MWNYIYSRTIWKKTFFFLVIGTHRIKKKWVELATLQITRTQSTYSNCIVNPVVDVVPFGFFLELIPKVTYFTKLLVHK